MVKRVVSINVKIVLSLSLVSWSLFKCMQEIRHYKVNLYFQMRHYRNDKVER